MTQGSKGLAAALPYLIAPATFLGGLVAVDVTATITGESTAHPLHADAAVAILLVGMFCAAAWARSGRSAYHDHEPDETAVIALPRAVGMATVYSSTTTDANRPPRARTRHRRPRGPRAPGADPSGNPTSGIDPEAIDAARRLTMRLTKPQDPRR